MKPERCSPSAETSVPPPSECPECDRQTVTTTLTPHTFTYGRGADAVQITAILPVRTCTHCGFQYLDKEGQRAQHDAVCRHLGVLTPSQIRAMREYHRLSPAEFARLTRLGTATIARWERGALIQNAANDLYLRLVGEEKNMQRLREWADSPPPSSAAPSAHIRRTIFATLTDDRMAILRIEQATFQL